MYMKGACCLMAKQLKQEIPQESEKDKEEYIFKLVVFNSKLSELVCEVKQ